MLKAASLPSTVQWNHATRKTHGQRLLDVTDGNLMLLSEQLRHADPRTTKAHYTEKPIDSILEAMEKVG
jgi:integrase